MLWKIKEKLNGLLFIYIDIKNYLNRHKEYIEYFKFQLFGNDKIGDVWKTFQWIFSYYCSMLYVIKVLKKIEMKSSYVNVMVVYQKT